MNITSDTILAGHSILKIRRLFQESFFCLLDIETAIHELETSEDQARVTLDELTALGYLACPYPTEKSPIYFLTDLGGQLAIASAARPIHRKTADRALKELLERVRQVNADSYYLYKVRGVHIFGSYLSEKERLSDVDVAVDIQPKYDPQKQAQLDDERSTLAKQKGHRFKNDSEYEIYPKKEVYRFLKNRSRSLSLCELRDLNQLLTYSEIIYSIDE